MSNVFCQVHHCYWNKNAECSKTNVLITYDVKGYKRIECASFVENTLMSNEEEETDAK